MQKKIISLLLILSLCILTTACSKKEEIEETEEKHYAVNEVKNNQETEEEIDEDSDNSLYQYSEYDVSLTSTNFGNTIVVYPDQVNNIYYINSIPYAAACPIKFSFNDIISDDYNYIELSKANHIYCSDNLTKLQLTDVKYNNSSSEQSLSVLVPFIDHIKLGKYSYTPNELFVSTDNFSQLITLLNKNYTNKSNNANSSNILDTYYKVEHNNNLYGDTYIWKYSINDLNLDYDSEMMTKINSYVESNKEDNNTSIDISQLDEEDLQDIDQSLLEESDDTDLNSELFVYAYYNYEGKLSYYTVSFQKQSIFNLDEITTTSYIQKPTGQYEDIILDMSGNEISEEEAEKYEEVDIIRAQKEIYDIEETIEPTGEYTISFSGYNFTNANMKLLDNSYIGLNNFSYTMHNSELNKSLVIDYIAN